MSIDVDKFGNVIVNQGGIAHRPGWVAISVKQNTLGQNENWHLVRGFGYWEAGLFKVKSNGRPIKVECNPSELSIDQFIGLTGWVCDEG